MNNKKKRFRQAAACFLAAALTIFSGPGVFFSGSGGKRDGAGTLGDRYGADSGSSGKKA